MVVEVIGPGNLGVPSQSAFAPREVLRDDLATFHDVAQIRNGSVAAQRVSEGIEQDHWLIPIEDQRSQVRAAKGSNRDLRLAST